MYLNVFLAAGDPSFMIMMILIIVVFYFFMILPQRKQRKEIEKFRKELKNGDKVITQGGIYGKVAEVRDKVIIIEVEGQMKLKVDKSVVLRDSTDLVQGQAAKK
jgi:preprotein translocase subunit YajC